MDNKVYLITIIENIGDNETAVTHKGFVMGMLKKLLLLKKRLFTTALAIG